MSSWVIVRYDGLILRLASAWAKIGGKSSGVGIIPGQTQGPSRTWLQSAELLWAVTNWVQLSGYYQSPLEHLSALHYRMSAGKLEIVAGGNQSALMTRWGIPGDSDRSRTDPGSPDHGHPYYQTRHQSTRLISLNPLAGSQLYLASTWSFVRL